MGNANGFSVREVIETAKLVTEKPIKLTQCDRPLGQPPILVSSGEKSEEVRAGSLNTRHQRHYASCLELASTMPWTVAETNAQQASWAFLASQPIGIKS